MKPVILVTPVDNGYILEALHPETRCSVGKRIATASTNSYDSNSVNSGLEKLLEIECHSAEASVEPDLFEVEDKPPVAWA